MRVRYCEAKLSRVAVFIGNLLSDVEVSLGTDIQLISDPLKSTSAGRISSKDALIREIARTGRMEVEALISTRYGLIHLRHSLQTLVQSQVKI